MTITRSRDWLELHDRELFELYDHVIICRLFNFLFLIIRMRRDWLKSRDDETKRQFRDDGDATE